jgi:hypothetical protein
MHGALNIKFVTLHVSHPNGETVNTKFVFFFLNKTLGSQPSIPSFIPVQMATGNYLLASFLKTRKLTYCQNKS